MRIILLLLIMLPVSLFAQKNKTSGYLIYTLGKDTTSVGKFDLNNGEFSLEIISRPPVTINKMKGRVSLIGELESAEGASYKPSDSGEPVLQTSYKFYIKDDSSFIETTPAGRTAFVSRFKGKGFTANGLGIAFRYFLPLWPGVAPVKVGDSLVSCHLTFGGCRTFILKRTSKDEVTAGSAVMGTLKLKLDKQGMLSSIDGIGSSWNVNGTVVSSFDLDALKDRFIKAEKSGTGLSTINALDSVLATVGKTNLKIVYSRPKARGRTIFGAVVPWDRFWRTGANAATRLVTDQPIRFGDKELPAGSYSVWTIPSQSGWTMMFNKQANIWGTEYKPEFDLFRVPMKSESLPELIEEMTIQIKQSEGGGIISVLWEKTKASVEFKTAD